MNIVLGLNVYLKLVSLCSVTYIVGTHWNRLRDANIQYTCMSFQ